MVNVLRYPQNSEEIKLILSSLDYSDAFLPNAGKDEVIKACNEAKK
jgi:hypothetical protein